MAKVLYITANPNPVEHSFGLTTGQAFVESYREANPSDEVVHLDLYKLNIPHIDEEVMGGWGKLRSGADFSTLSAGEQAKVTRLNELADEFVGADKYVFVTPFWNFSFPPVFKAYIDSICVAGKTFKYTEQGPQGLLGGKKAVHIQASGGVYSEGPTRDWDFGNRYLATIAQFLGFSLESIFVEGQAAQPDKAAEIKAAGVEKAKQVAKSF
ncbi:FMN-dependent NADH-azoreductase [Tumebacillus sp. ITR2]|uniref:FMN dependent NADH:quinone oxidoreductase n=1 Tax=Tumebacillus amylolyticus TaxID=2801339 RepID=A0ABS1JB94_9BACL|nr:FMN-dependent NADH-azoreductase [Tumebacillus amylolyticus]MBL0386878.1 FMN-dependent NADH-azoreductase [Tumebacillus amylolyticus]